MSRIYNYQNYIHGVDKYTPNCIVAGKSITRFPWETQYDTEYDDGYEELSLLQILPTGGFSECRIYKDNTIGPINIKSANTKIAQITNSVVIYENGEVYTHYNKKIILPEGTKALSAYTHGDTGLNTIILLDNNTIFMIKEEPGSFIQDYEIKQANDLLLPIEKVACTTDIFIILYKEGGIKAFGTDSIYDSHVSNLKLHCPKEKEKYIDISTDGYFAVAIRQNGYTNYWGTVRKLGTGEFDSLSSGNYDYPTTLEAKAIVCNKYGLYFAISQNSNKINYGMADTNRAEIMNMNIITNIPQIPENETIVDIALSEFRAYVKTNTGQVYTWGGDFVYNNGILSEIPKYHVAKITDSKYLLLVGNEAYSLTKDGTKMFKVQNHTKENVEKYGMEGYDFINKIRKDAEKNILPVIVEINNVLDSELFSYKGGIK